jgi:REP element-mobilizing transposase RayT
MARKPRIEYEGAFYHVITRGNQKQRIFRDVADYDKYHQYLTIYKNRYHYALYAYVLMGNHVHLLMETRDIPLSKIMQGINQSYTRYFNRKYREVGHLFQGRYKAILCDRDAYLLSLLKYIHNNPVRAKIAETADTYRWSSHQAYLGKSNSLGLVDTDHVLRMFSESKSRALRHYVAFMRAAAALKRGEVYATIDQRLQGDQEFIDQVQQRIDGEIKKERRKKEHSLPAICRVVEERHGISRDRLRSSGKERQVMIARRVFTQTAKLYGYRGKEIAAYLRKDPASVTGYLREEDHGREVVKVTKRLDEVGKNVNTEV